MDMQQLFDSFFKKLDKEHAVDTAYFKRVHNIKHNIAAYYLKKATYSGKILCVKIRNKTYYMHKDNLERFKKFESLKIVKIIYG